MSGGHFQCVHQEFEDLSSDELDEMADELENFSSDAANDTRDVAIRVDALKKQIEKLNKALEPIRNVWRAIDWNRSGDCKPSDVDAAVEGYLRTK